MAQIAKEKQTPERVMKYFDQTGELLPEVWHWTTGCLEELKEDIPEDSKYKRLRELINNRMC